MLKSKKRYLLYLRKQHYSIHNIAKEIDESSQVVHNYLRRIKNSVCCSDKPVFPDITDEQFRLFVVLYVEDRSLEEIAKHIGTDVETLEMILCFLTSKLHKRYESEYYPAVAEWITNNNWTYQTMGEAIGCGAPKISKILQGRCDYPMTMEFAEKISQVTGLSIAEIFKVQIGSDPTLKKMLGGDQFESIS